MLFSLVGPLGLEPRLFGTKNRRVASYTMGHSDGAKVVTKINYTPKNMKKNEKCIPPKEKRLNSMDLAKNGC